MAKPRVSTMKPLVLIVEDEAPLVTLLRYNLEREGFAVTEAYDGEEALLRVAEDKPDAMLLDLMLPLVSGLEVCRQLRRMPTLCSLRRLQMLVFSIAATIVYGPHCRNKLKPSWKTG